MSNHYSLTQRQRETADCFALLGEEPVSLAQLEEAFLQRVRDNQVGEGLSQADYEFECQQEHIVELRFEKP